MALSLALDLIGGPVFECLSVSVIRAVERKVAFTDLLQDMKYTLVSLKRQTRVILEIQGYNLELSLSNNEIINLATKMAHGRHLVDRLSSIKFRLWNFGCGCTSNCVEQLKELNRDLESLFETLHLEQLRDTKEILKLARQNRDDLEKMKVMLEKILQRIDDPEVKGLLKNLVEQNSGVSTETSTSTPTSTPTPNSTSASGRNTKDEGNGVTQAASLEGLVESAFRLLIDAVIEVKESSMMFRTLLRRLKSTLDCFRPFIEEMIQDNKVLDHPKEELEKLTIQMENGIHLIRKFSSVCRWTSNKKDNYTNQVFELDKFLQGQLSILTVKVARDVKGTSELIRNIQEVVKRIEGSDMVQKQVEFQGSCDITEPPIPPVESEVLNMQRTRNVKETLVSEVQNQLEFKGSCDVSGPSSYTVGLEDFKQGRKDVMKETLQRESVFPKRPGQPECQFYMRTGNCEFGADCRYHHPVCVSSPTDLPLRPRESVFPKRPGKLECIAYIITGDCKYGASCVFHHPDYVSSPTGLPLQPQQHRAPKAHHRTSSDLSHRPAGAPLSPPLQPSANSCFAHFHHHRCRRTHRIQLGTTVNLNHHLHQILHQQSSLPNRFDHRHHHPSSEASPCSAATTAIAPRHRRRQTRRCCKTGSLPTASLHVEPISR